MKLDIKMFSIILSFSMLFSVIGISSVMGASQYTKISQIALDTNDDVGNPLNTYVIYDGSNIEEPSISLDTAQLVYSSLFNIDYNDASSLSDANNKTRMRISSDYYDSGGSLVSSYSDTVTDPYNGTCVDSGSNYYVCGYRKTITMTDIWGVTTVSEGEYFDVVIQYQILE